MTNNNKKGCDKKPNKSSNKVQKNIILKPYRNNENIRPSLLAQGVRKIIGKPKK